MQEHQQWTVYRKTFSAYSGPWSPRDKLITIGNNAWGWKKSHKRINHRNDPWNSRCMDLQVGKGGHGRVSRARCKHIHGPPAHIFRKSAYYSQRETIAAAGMKNASPSAPDSRAIFPHFHFIANKKWQSEFSSNWIIPTNIFVNHLKLFIISFDVWMKQFFMKMDVLIGNIVYSARRVLPNVCTEKKHRPWFSWGNL